MMNQLLGLAMRRLAATTSIGSIAAMSCAGTAMAQSATVSLPALPMADALQRIQAATGKSVSYDPDAVSGLTSAPIADARSAERFNFTTTEAWLIEDGRLTAPIDSATLIGVGHEALKGISMIGHDLALDDGEASCGKQGQSLDVGVGQPTIRIDAMMVGGRNG